MSADIIKFALVANISIASLNASLLVNTVGFYQVIDSVELQQQLTQQCA